MRSIFLALTLAAIASAQSPTTISDVVFVPSNSGLFQGRIVISTDTQFEFAGQTYTRAWRQAVTVNNGIFTLSLPPNDATFPTGTSYIAEFEPASGGGYTERWVVPTSAQSVTIAQIRTAVITIPGRPISPVQLSRAGANVGDLLRWSGNSWVPAPGTSVIPITLDELLDVNAGLPTTGQYLRFSGTEWLPALITQSDVNGLVAALAAKAALVHGHAIADTSGLQSALDAKAAAIHAHAIADVTALQTALDGKAPAAHVHTIAGVTGLQTALDGKAAASHTHAISDTTGLQGLLDSKAALVHLHAIADTSGLQSALDAKAAATHGHAQSDVTGLVTALAGKSAIGHVHLISDISTLQAMLDAKAPLLSPALAGTPTAPTQALSDNSTAIATTAWVKGQGYGAGGGGGAADLNGLSDVIITSPTTGQLLRYTGTSWENAAAQLSDVAGLVAVLAGKAASVHGHIITDVTGLQSALDAKAAAVHAHAIADTTGLQAALDAKAAATHTHIIANITGLQTALDAKSPLDSPAFTGAPTGPTPSTPDNSTRLATTAWVRAQGYGAGGGSTTLAALTDVTITSPTSGHMLKFNGSLWANAALAITDIAALQSELDLKAPLASPALTGTPTAPTPGTPDNSTRIATTAWVRAQGYGAGGGGSSTLDGLTDVAITSPATGQVLRYNGAEFINAAIAQSDVTGLVSALAGKAASVHTHIIADTTGLQTALDGKAAASHTHAISDTTGLVSALALLAPLASPALTGTPTAPTQSLGDNSTAIATTAWVKGQGYGGGGAAQLCAVSATSTVVTVAAPCRLNFGDEGYIELVGNQTFTRTAGSGSGLGRIYINSTGTVYMQYTTGALTMSTTSGAMAIPVALPDWDEGMIHLAEVQITAGNFGALADARGIRRDAVAAGTGIEISGAAGAKVIGIDTAIVARMGGDNTWTGINDFSAATSMRGVLGATDPATCLVGQLFFNTTSATQKVCTAANTWSAIGAGGGGSGITALTGDVTASGTGSVAATLANNGVTAGSCGSATESCVLVIDTKGRVTSRGVATISGGGGSGSGAGGIARDIWWSRPLATFSSGFTHATPSSNGFNATEASVHIVLPHAITARNMYMRTTTAQSAGGALSCVVRKNGASTALSVTAAANAAAGDFMNTTDSVTFAANDRIGVACSSPSGGSASISNISFSMEAYAPIEQPMPFLDQVTETSFVTSTQLSKHLLSVPDSGTQLRAVLIENGDVGDLMWVVPRINASQTWRFQLANSTDADTGTFSFQLKAACWPVGTRAVSATVIEDRTFTVPITTGQYYRSQTVAPQTFDVSGCPAGSLVSYRFRRNTGDAAANAWLSMVTYAQ